jgi:hypothetical protein
LGSDSLNAVTKIKNLEIGRLVAPVENVNSDSTLSQTLPGDESDTDSDAGLNPDMIHHLVGDIAKDILDEDGSHWSDFKTVPRRSKSGSNKKINKKKTKVRHNKRYSK